MILKSKKPVMLRNLLRRNVKQLKKVDGISPEGGGKSTLQWEGFFV